MKISGLATLAFSLGGIDYLDNIDDITLDVKNSEEDTSSIRDRWWEGIIVGSEWTCSGSKSVDTTNSPLIIAAASGDVEGSLVFNSGRVALSGTVLITSASLKVGKKKIQMIDFDLRGNGPPTITAV